MRIFLIFLLSTISLTGMKTSSSDFPTLARSEFVFACMSSNASNRDFMAKCSCAIDEIAKRMTYKEYVKLRLLLDYNTVQVQGKKHIKVLVCQKSVWINYTVHKLHLN